MIEISSAKIIILDRDGVINQDSKHYIKSADEFIFLPGSAEAIAKLTKQGFKIGIATNQSGISRGYYDEKVLQKIHDKMLTVIGKAGGRIDEIAYCQHLPSDLCDCRKPKPGMLLDLAHRFQCDPSQIIFIGDKETDIMAALSIGATPILVYSPMTTENIVNKYPGVLAFYSLAECVENLITYVNKEF